MQAEKTGIAELDAYLARMARELKRLPAAEREDLLREIAGNLQDSLASSTNTTDALARFGPAEQFAAALLSERQVAVDRRRTSGEVGRIIARAALIPFVWSIVVFSVLMMLNTWYLYAELARLWSIGVVARLLVLNLPAVLELALGVAALFAGLTGLPKLARELSQPLFRAVLPFAIGGILAGGAFVAGANFYFADHVVPGANRAVVDLVRSQMHLPPDTPAERSPQERSLAAIGRHIAAMQTKPVTTPDTAKELRKWRLSYQYRIAFSALPFVLAALGTTLGALFARKASLRRPRVGLMLGWSLGLFLAVCGLAVVFTYGRAFQDWEVYLECAVLCLGLTAITARTGAPEVGVGMDVLYLVYGAMALGHTTVATIGPLAAAWAPVGGVLLATLLIAAGAALSAPGEPEHV
ncbi:MAG TPA: hypothetical protein V6D47_18835 [Oscillatoriaceae cyanobacterium]